jgi:TIR domain/PBS lyase HEAT-like repeat
MEGPKWDCFISHASEDKDTVVLGLAAELRKLGFRVWLDATELKIGDHLREKIDEGLAHSRFGIVILSQPFFQKGWPQNELGGLGAREENGTRVILPVWHKIEFDDVVKHSPLLAGRVAGKTQDGIEVLAIALASAMGRQVPAPVGLQLGAFGKTLAQCLADLSNPSAKVRARAAWALGDMGPAAKSAVPALVRILDDPETAGEAIDAIRRIDPQRPDLVLPLVDLLGASPAVADSARRLLVLNAPDSVRALCRALADEKVREGAT